MPAHANHCAAATKIRTDNAEDNDACPNVTLYHGLMLFQLILCICTNYGVNWKLSLSSLLVSVEGLEFLVTTESGPKRVFFGGFRTNLRAGKLVFERRVLLHSEGKWLPAEFAAHRHQVAVGHGGVLDLSRIGWKRG